MEQSPTFNSPNPVPVEGVATTRILKRIEAARQKLVETSLRNRLLNTRLDAARSLRIFGESSDQVFQLLVTNKSAMSFRPVPSQITDPAAADAPEARDEHSNYLPELEDDEVSRQSDSAMQTRLEATKLETRLKGLYYEALEYEEEQGVNVLFLALGFLLWYENANSDEPRYAPLVLLPVELVREGARSRFKLKLRDEDLFSNVSLKLFLAEQHGVTLPDLPEEVEWTPGSYMEAVASAIAHNPKWQVIPNEILLGFFSFSKFLLWRDLDPKNWPTGRAPHENPVVGKLLASTSERAEPNPPIVPPGEKLDDHFSPRQLVYVLDADSSQTEAIQMALSGRDLTIQGPPGTGKSQTIANVIAAAASHGKRILFVAEKMAALEVVHNRLEKTGLGPLCLELHSRKASKTAVHAQLKAALDLPNTTGVSRWAPEQA